MSVQGVTAALLSIEAFGIIETSQPLRESLMALVGVKASFFEAAILMVAPAAKLRPSRSGVAFTLNLPKAWIEVSAPLASASAICEE
jgi:hypothetical protein